jgi:hypothetical protein
MLFRSKEPGPIALTDSMFWDIVRNDPAFHARFHGRAHHLQESNGGVDFHARPPVESR